MLICWGEWSGNVNYLMRGSTTDKNTLPMPEFRGECPDCFEITGKNQYHSNKNNYSKQCKVCRSARKTQRLKPWSRWATAEEDRAESTPIRQEQEMGCSLHRLTRIGKMVSCLMRPDLSCDIWSRYGQHKIMFPLFLCVRSSGWWWSNGVGIFSWHTFSSYYQLTII